MSTWVDQLLADFAAEELAKVEIYTFAAAANHFSVPYTIVKGQKRFVFGAVEHFANTRDYVSRIGVLAFAPTPPDGTAPGQLPTVAAEGRFAGRIFKRVGTTGHLLLSHYFRNGSSILDHPTVRQYSQLTKYLDNRGHETVQRVAHVNTVKTDTPGQPMLLPTL